VGVASVLAGISRRLARAVGGRRRWPDRPDTLPVLVLFPHSGCNCHCVMCDIWKANRDRRELTANDLRPHLDGIAELGVEWVVLSGGEPLMHSHLWPLCSGLKEFGVAITLLSTGLLLEEQARDVVRWCDEVIVSLDGTRETHDAIRRVPGAWDALAGGVAALRRQDEGLSVSARCVIQKRNFRELGAIVIAARELGLDAVSFLPADTTSSAFNRPERWTEDRIAEVALDDAEVAELAEVVESVIREHRASIDDGFIAESPDKLRGLVRHYASLNGTTVPDTRRCNAPWVSAVVEADGTVRPCFFHRPFGNIADAPLDEILRSGDAVAFRRELDVARDPTCRTCVCTLWYEAG
jgi:MoaA/NifB/PqqE/SkfB family radical SAM enzyme